MLANVQMLLEDPFDPDGPDGIRQDDFQFTGIVATEVTPGSTSDQQLSYSGYNHQMINFLHYDKLHFI